MWPYNTTITKLTVEKTAEVLYELCKDRGKSVKEISLDLIAKLGFVPKEQSEVEDVVREYRIHGRGLEDTAKAIIKLSEKTSVGLDLSGLVFDKDS